MGAVPGHEHCLGHGDRVFRRTGYDFLALAAGGWSPRRANRRRQAVGDHLHPAVEYLGQQLNTSGGVAPSTGCTLATDVGQRAFVPYTADYFFDKAAKSEEEDTDDDDDKED
jgi:hypothetical protein